MSSNADPKPSPVLEADALSTDLKKLTLEPDPSPKTSPKPSPKAESKADSKADSEPDSQAASDSQPSPKPSPKAEEPNSSSTSLKKPFKTLTEADTILKSMQEKSTYMVTRCKEKLLALRMDCEHQRGKCQRTNDRKELELLGRMRKEIEYLELVEETAGGVVKVSDSD